MKGHKKFKPHFFRRIGVGTSSVGNPSEKLRIGTLPIEESLAHERSEMHLVSPSETCTTLSRTGALARAVHKANVCECTFLPYALRGGWLSAFTPPSLSKCKSPKAESRERPDLCASGTGKEKQPGQSPADPAEAGSTPKRKAQPDPTRSGSPRSSKSGKTPLGLPKRQCRPM